MADRICTEPKCERTHYGLGLCQMHWGRQRKNGSTKLATQPTVIERFWAKVDKTDTCWNWTGALGASPPGAQGYGTFNLGGRVYVRAHRFSYELTYGAIPAGMHIDHRCFNRGCVNPAHLRTVTSQQNVEHHPGGARVNSKSGVRGVSWSKSKQKWLAQVTHDGRVVFSKTFDDLAAAENAVVEARNRIHTHNDMDRTEVA